MAAIIYCVETNYGEHSFYLATDNGEYFLFKQAFRCGVHAHFQNGLRLEDAFNYSKARNDVAIIRTISKLPTYIRYIESEYGITVLKQTRKQQLHRLSLKKLSA